MILKNKRILVTGSDGLIGKEMVLLLQSKGAKVKLADIKTGQDLRCFDTCLKLCKNTDIVINLMGVKGSPRMTKTRPVDFMGPMLQCDTNMILAAQQQGVKEFVYTSSIALLNLHTDKFPATAKQTAETLIEAMKVQYPKGTKYYIIRPASVYGRFENYNRDGLMVISDMIKRAVNENKTIELWDDGEGLRDFINAKDVARAVLLVLKHKPENWIALGSGKAYKIFEAASFVCQYAGKMLITSNEKTGKGDNRTMNIPELEAWGFKESVNLEQGIKEAIEYAKSNLSNKR